MIEKIIYTCEICGDTSKYKETIEDCELKGYGREYPIGLIFGNHSPSAFYKDITFAVAKNDLIGHYNNISLWACRDNGVYDSLDSWICGSNGSIIYSHYTLLDFKHPTFLRMVKWLESQNIVPYVWDGECAILLEGIKHDLHKM